MRGRKGKIDKRREMGTANNNMLNNTQMLLKEYGTKMYKKRSKTAGSLVG